MLRVIEVRSKSLAKEFQPDEPWAAISIASYEHDWPKLNGAKRMGLLQLWFADVEFEHAGSEYTLFNSEHAKQIFEFVADMESKGVEILMVHCEAGISRSPAIACALAQTFLGAKAKDYFTEPHPTRADETRYYPNKLVYKRMIQEGIRLGHIKYTEEFSPFVQPDDDDFYHFRVCGGMQ